MYLFLLTIAVGGACSGQNRLLEGSGRVVAVSVPAVSDFSEIEIYGLVGHIEVEVGVTPGISITADDNLAGRIEVRLDNGRLIVAIPDNRDNRLWIENTHIRVAIGAPALQSLDLAYNGRCVVRGLQNADLFVRKGQNGDLLLFGAVGNLRIAKTGNGDILADSLFVRRAEVASEGNGEVRLRVSEQLDATRNGNGEVINVAAPAGLETEVPPQPPYIDLVLVNKSVHWRRGLVVRGPESARFGYGFDLGPFGKRPERWPVGARVLNRQGRVLYEVRAEDAGRDIALPK